MQITSLQAGPRFRAQSPPFQFVALQPSRLITAGIFRRSFWSSNFIVWFYLLPFSKYCYFKPPPCCFRWWQVLMSTSNYSIFLSPVPEPGPLLTHGVTLLSFSAEGPRPCEPGRINFLLLFRGGPSRPFFQAEGFSTLQDKQCHSQKKYVNGSELCARISLCVYQPQQQWQCSSSNRLQSCKRRNDCVSIDPNEIESISFSLLIWIFYFNF